MSVDGTGHPVLMKLSDHQLVPDSIGELGSTVTDVINLEAIGAIVSDLPDLDDATDTAARVGRRGTRTIVTVGRSARRRPLVSAAVLAMFVAVVVLVLKARRDRSTNDRAGGPGR